MIFRGSTRIREDLRLWWEESDRAIARLSLVDRTTVTIYVAALGGRPEVRRIAPVRPGRSAERRATIVIIDIEHWPGLTGRCQTITCLVIAVGVPSQPRPPGPVLLCHSAD